MNLTSKEKEIYNMLEYLSKSYEVRKFNDDFSIAGGIYDWENHINDIGKNGRIITAKELQECEGHSFSINFITKTIDMYAYDVSYHNGDHYNCHYVQLRWDAVLGLYDWALLRVKEIAKKQVLSDFQNSLVDAKIKNVLGGV